MDNALKKRLEALVKLPENQKCADCRKRGPRWASANLGVFICIECSGIHRNLGTHISFVRSVNLDTWTKAQVDGMEEWGNERANAYYEASMPSSVQVPREGDSVRIVEKFIRDKYQYKRFIGPIPSLKGQSPSPAPIEQAAASNKKMVMVSAQSKQNLPVAQPVAAPVQQPVVEASLIDFNEISSPAPQQPFQQNQQQQQYQQPQQQQHQFNAFDFPTAAPVVQQQQQSQPAPQQDPTHEQQQAAANAWMNFDAPPQAPQAAVPAVPTKPMASADAILSLYNVPAVPTYGAPGGWGMSPNQMYGQYPGQYPPSAGMMMNSGNNVQGAGGMMYPGMAMPHMMPPMPMQQQQNHQQNPSQPQQYQQQPQQQMVAMQSPPKPQPQVQPQQQQQQMYQQPQQQQQPNYYQQQQPPAAAPSLTLSPGKPTPSTLGSININPFGMNMNTNSATPTIPSMAPPPVPGFPPQQLQAQPQYQQLQYPQQLPQYPQQAPQQYQQQAPQYIQQSASYPQQQVPQYQQQAGYPPQQQQQYQHQY